MEVESKPFTPIHILKFTEVRINLVQTELSDSRNVNVTLYEFFLQGINIYFCNIMVRLVAERSLVGLHLNLLIKTHNLFTCDRTSFLKEMLVQVHSRCLLILV